MVDSTARQRKAEITPHPEIGFEKHFSQLANLFRLLRQSGLTFGDCQAIIDNPEQREELVRRWKFPGSSLRIFNHVRDRIIIPELLRWDDCSLRISHDWLVSLDSILFEVGVHPPDVIEQLCASNDSYFLGEWKAHASAQKWSLEDRCLVLRGYQVPSFLPEDFGSVAGRIVKQDFLLALAVVLL